MSFCPFIYDTNLTCITNNTNNSNNSYNTNDTYSTNITCTSLKYCALLTIPKHGLHNTDATEQFFFVLFFYNSNNELY